MNITALELVQEKLAAAEAAFGVAHVAMLEAQRQMAIAEERAGRAANELAEARIALNAARIS